MANGGRVGVVIPVRGLRSAKTRLARALSEDERADLVAYMLANVVRAAHNLPVTIVSPRGSHDIEQLARDLGVSFLFEQTSLPDLNMAAAEGVGHFANEGFSRVIVAHADLPFAQDLRAVADGPGVVMVPDRARSGTTVLSVPACAGFKFAYGPDSLRHHAAEAVRLGLTTIVVTKPDGLEFDLDEPEDLLCWVPSKGGARSLRITLGARGIPQANVQIAANADRLPGADRKL